MQLGNVVGTQRNDIVAVSRTAHDDGPGRAHDCHDDEARDPSKRSAALDTHGLLLLIMDFRYDRASLKRMRT